MTNSDVLRRLRYCLDLNDTAMIDIFGQADMEVSREQVNAWLKKDDDPGYQSLHDKQLASFLNGLINFKRGRLEGVQPAPEKALTNNIILRKLKIALDLQSDDVLALLALADQQLSKHELSAFFRKPEHKHFRLCKDQILRNFLQGLQMKLRPPEPGKEAFVWPTLDTDPKPEK